MSVLEGTVVHAYGLVDPGVPVSLPAGIAGAPVSVVPVGDLAALASELSAESYGAEAWQEHGGDPRWLERVAGEHNAVLQAVVQVNDVLPLRLPGIYPDLETMRRVLHTQHDTLAEAFARVRRHVELGAKVYVVTSTARAEEEPRPSSGRDYLARRSAEAGRREEARLRRQARVLEAHEVMARASTHAATSPPQDAALSGRPEPMLLNASYLVARDDFDAFISLAEELGVDLGEQGMSLEITGPWPPYNFVVEPEHVEGSSHDTGATEEVR